MSEPHLTLNALNLEEARQVLLRCCGSRRWVERMLERRPFASASELHGAAEAVWAELAREDYLEAFAAHPRIGADLAELRRKFAPAADWSAEEQAGARGAADSTLEGLRDGNAAYAERFGYTFIVCATGKTAEEMLALLRTRLHHLPERELSIAAAEQAKITRLRLDKLG